MSFITEDKYTESGCADALSLHFYFIKRYEFSSALLRKLDFTRECAVTSLALFKQKNITELRCLFLFDKVYVFNAAKNPLKTFLAYDCNQDLLKPLTSPLLEGKIKAEVSMESTGCLYFMTYRRVIEFNAASKQIRKLNLKLHFTHHNFISEHPLSVYKQGGLSCEFYVFSSTQMAKVDVLHEQVETEQTISLLASDPTAYSICSLLM
eukprot:CAMPEP_0204916902 /NCGR_PEP_ID=MMETSP1397-20131031/14614_1 /ASSEMBLY_ACC=CAM_ASM_000891 /TAXON_ID=49980 /ORGANISM="Climacostomum Climacostomum virens, Strain Stock W-24" /LENGTH=207 /DNA_ID=CAMNT_0052089577 /DNA_START=262 /DNA_END=885 /DNA_ORIENTATION=+